MAWANRFAFLFLLFLARDRSFAIPVWFTRDGDGDACVWVALHFTSSISCHLLPNLLFLHALEKNRPKPMLSVKEFAVDATVIAPCSRDFEIATSVECTNVGSKLARFA